MGGVAGLEGGSLAAAGARQMDRLDARAARRRLHLVANNARLLILPPWRQPNLASRILSLSTRRLSADFQAAYGHPVAETFVEPNRGTCYRAANWREVGFTKGYERISGGGYREHGTSRKILMFQLEKDVREQLCMLSDDESWNCKTLDVDVIPAHRMGSLYEYRCRTSAVVAVNAISWRQFSR